MQLSDLKAYCFTNDVDPDDATTAAELELAAISGTGTPLDAPLGPVNLGNGLVGMVQTITLIAGPAPTPETLHGYVLIDSTTGDLAGGAQFWPPRHIGRENDYVTFTAAITLEGKAHAGDY